MKDYPLGRDYKLYELDGYKCKLITGVSYDELRELAGDNMNDPKWFEILELDARSVWYARQMGALNFEEDSIPTAGVPGGFLQVVMEDRGDNYIEVRRYKDRGLNIYVWKRNSWARVTDFCVDAKEAIKLEKIMKAVL